MIPAAQFLRNQSADFVWKAILRCWSGLYLGPSDLFDIDQGSNFVAKVFLECAKADGVSILPALVESPSTMRHAERYHASLRSAYQKMRDSLRRTNSDEDCLQLAIKAVNDTIGFEGLYSILLVLGAISRFAR